MKIACIEIVRWKRGLSRGDLELLADPASPLVANVTYRWQLLFKGPAGPDRLATRFWTYQKPDKSRAYGRGAAWMQRRKRDWSDLTKGIFSKHRLVAGFASYRAEPDIDDDEVKSAIKRQPRDVLIQAHERWWGDVDIGLREVRACGFEFPYQFGFDGQDDPEEYIIRYRRPAA